MEQPQQQEGKNPLVLLVLEDLSFANYCNYFWNLLDTGLISWTICIQ